MDGSVSFDRAARYYDRTRRLSPAGLQRVVGVLAGELTGRGRCLEVGVGTGMIALPLAEAGVDMVGVDLSDAMLGRLMEKAGGGPPIALVRGDATALPFRDGAFGGAVLRHVLHLIPRWEGAVRAAARAVRPGSVLLVNHGHYPQPYREVFAQFVRRAEVDRPWAGLPPDDLAPLDGVLGSLGASPRPLEPVGERMEEPVSEFVEGMRDGLFSWTWGVEEGTRRRVAEEVRGWAEARFGDLEAPTAREYEIRFRAYDLP